MNLPFSMRTARPHEVGEPLVIDDVALPMLSASDVMVCARACGIVPKLGDGPTYIAGSGALDLSAVAHRIFALKFINEALAQPANRDGGFSNFVITP